MNTTDILLSGLLGAIIGSLIQPIANWINSSRRRSNVRIAIGSYLHQVIQMHLETYIKNCNGAINEIQRNPFPPTKDKFIYDSLPMLNSDLIKAYTAEELLTVLKDKNTFIKIMELAYSIDYLKSKMPFDFANEYVNYLTDHLKMKGFTTDLEKENHINECNDINIRQTNFVAQIDFRIQNCNECKQLTSDILASIHHKII